MQNIQQNNSSEKKWCVIIPTFNNDKTLEKVLKEVLNICKNIIVVNDGSDDNTSQILKNFSDKMISFYIGEHVLNEQIYNKLCQKFSKIVEGNKTDKLFKYRHNY